MATWADGTTSSRSASQLEASLLEGTSVFYNGGSHYAETFDRRYIRDSTIPLAASGIMFFTAIPLIAGRPYTTITFRSGGTAAVTPTHWWMALYDTSATPVLIDQTTDQTTTAVPGSTVVSKSLSLGAYTPTITGLYYVAIMFAAATVPTVLGFTGGSGASNAGLVGTQKAIVGSSGTGLTTTAPSTITGAIGQFQGIPYMVMT